MDFKRGGKVVLSLYLTIVILFFCVLMGTDRIVLVYSDQIQKNEIKTIIIDAGHGGEDGGASTASGITESSINLKFAIKLQDLCRLLGIRTVMIRCDDRSVYTQGKTLSQKKVSDLKERVRICNETENAILISIHQNFYTDEKYRGSQVFYTSKDDSKDLAQQLQTVIRSSLQPENHRKIQRARGIYLMDHITCTGVLIECGFLSNPEEAQLLQNNIYQNNMCSTIASALSSYLAEER